MPGPQDDPTKVYTISPDYMETMIGYYLTPVIDKLGEIRDGYAAARGEVKTAHDSEAPGWFGGEGHGAVKAATSSFLNEIDYQLEQLVADQTELASSLTAYRASLLKHIGWARNNDLRQADGFAAIQRRLDEMGW